MNFITKLFQKQKIDCPRCLGKGNVDWEDIRRLRKELRWAPGQCAYCNGTGKVSPGTVSALNVDNTYLTVDLPPEERKRLLDGDKGAIQRANQYETQVDDFIKQIDYLHFVGGLDSGKIAEFYFLPESESGKSQTEKQELIEYIEKVIVNRNKGR